MLIDSGFEITPSFLCDLLKYTHSFTKKIGMLIQFFLRNMHNLHTTHYTITRHTDISDIDNELVVSVDYQELHKLLPVL